MDSECSLRLTVGVIECQRDGRMNNEKILFNWSDAWLMLAISLANQRGPATLETIIAAGDEINFSIFYFEELASGLVRLSEARYVAERSGAFYPTENVRPHSDKYLSDGQSTDKRLEDVQKMLGAAAAFDDQPCKNNLRYPGLTKEKYEEVIRRYKG
jgi:hypothetical protein